MSNNKTGPEREAEVEPKGNWAGRVFPVYPGQVFFNVRDL